ncbi:MAG: peptidoglycan D,D-transpeptidase FtsI family protein, partial [Acidimicrobiales bacterium]
THATRASRPPARRRAAPSRGVLGRRVRFFRVVMVLVFALIVARLVDVQVLSSGRYQAQASEELTQHVPIPALRGAIYARDGTVLAMSEPTKTVIADDFQIRHPVTEAGRLAPLLGLQPGPLASELHQHSGYVPLARNVPEGRAGRVAAGHFAGVTMVAGSERVTPDGSLGAPVVGAVHASGAGASGVEYQENHLLAGTPGGETLLESPSGVALPGTPVAEHHAAHPGTGVELTLDQSLQYTTEQDLAAQIEATGAVNGVAEVMDVRTGDVLSMASLVNNTPHAGTGAGGTAQAAGGTVAIGTGGPVSEAPGNLAVSQIYEPGSVFKLVTFSAALQDGLISPTTAFTVPDQIQYDGSTFHDAETHPTEQLTATQILAQSSNIGTSEIAHDLGESRLLAQVGALGFGKRTALDFPGEEAGIIAGPQQWEPTNYVSLPIGQVDAVTAQQVLDAYNAVADGGVMVQPRLVQATVAGGHVTSRPPSARHRVIAASTDAELTTMLQQVVDGGTGTSAFIPGYSVAGKTGTAQIPATGQDSYVTGAYMATFVGFAPASHPVLAAIVVLDRPTPIYGGTVAAPVFSQIMRYALHRYDIPTTSGASTQAPPAGTTASLATQDVT